MNMTFVLAFLYLFLAVLTTYIADCIYDGLFGFKIFTFYDEEAFELEPLLWDRSKIVGLPHPIPLFWHKGVQYEVLEYNVSWSDFTFIGDVPHATKFTIVVRVKEISKITPTRVVIENIKMLVRRIKKSIGHKLVNEQD